MAAEWVVFFEGRQRMAKACGQVQLAVGSLLAPGDVGRGGAVRDALRRTAQHLHLGRAPVIPRP